MKRAGSWAFWPILGALAIVRMAGLRWVYEEPGFIDGFAYLGTIFDPVTMRRAFPKHPAGDLLPVIWPKHAFYAAFSPDMANDFCKFLPAALFIYLIYLIGSRLKDPMFGFLAAAMAFGNAYFWQVFSSDYPESMAALYVTLAMYFATRAGCRTGSDSGFERVAELVALGFSMAAGISSAFLSLGYMGVITLYYYALKWTHRKRLIEGVDAFAVAGFLSAIGLMALGHWTYTGSFVYFQSTLKKAEIFLSQDRRGNPFWAWFPDARWLDPALLAVCWWATRIFRSLKTKKVNGLLTPVFAALSCAVGCVFYLCYLQFVRHQGTISDPYYFCQLLGLLSLAAAAVFDDLFGQVFRGRHKLTVVYTLIVLCFGIFALQLMSLRAFELSAALLILALLRMKIRMSPVTALLAWGAILLAVLNATNALGRHGRFRQDSIVIYDANSGRDVAVSGRKANFRSAADWFYLAQELDPKRQGFLWYDVSEPLGGFFRTYCAASHLWQGGLINEHFPEVDVPTNDWHGPLQIDVRAGQNLLVLTSRRAEKLPILAANLEKKGLRAETLYDAPFKSGVVAFDVIKLHLEAR